MNHFILTEQQITDSELAIFEQQIGLELPESYKKHILNIQWRHSGGKGQLR